MTIEFNCSHCGKALSTGDEKAGRKARCPDCQEPIEVPLVNTEGVVLSPVSVSPPPLPTAMPTGRPCPMCGQPSVSGDRVCSACGEPLTGNNTSSSSRSGEPVAFRLGSVLSRSWNLLFQNLGLLVGGQVIGGFLAMAAMLPGIAAFAIGLAIVNQQEDVDPAVGVALIAGGVLLGLVGICVAMWISIGMQMLILGVVRSHPVSFNTLFQGGHFLLRSLVCMFLFQIVIQIGSQLCVLPGLIAAVFLWPWQLLLIDKDLPHISALLESPKLSAKSWLSTIGLFIMTYVIIFLGVLALGVGLLIAAPLVAVCWCVAYDEMGGISDDRLDEPQQA